MLFMGEEWGAGTPVAVLHRPHRTRRSRPPRQPDARRSSARTAGRRTRSPIRRTPRRSPAPSSTGPSSTEEPHARLLAFYRDLLALRRAHPELRDGRLDRADVSWAGPAAAQHAGRVRRAGQPVRRALDLRRRPGRGAAELGSGRHGARRLGRRTPAQRRRPRLTASGRACAPRDHPHTRSLAHWPDELGPDQGGRRDGGRPRPVRRARDRPDEPRPELRPASASGSWQQGGSSATATVRPLPGRERLGPHATPRSPGPAPGRRAVAARAGRPGHRRVVRRHRRADASWSDRLHLGGVVAFSANITSAAQIARSNRALQRSAARAGRAGRCWSASTRRAAGSPG